MAEAAGTVRRAITMAEAITMEVTITMEAIMAETFSAASCWVWASAL
jgi:hypothetical protein